MTRKCVSFGEEIKQIKFASTPPTDQDLLNVSGGQIPDEHIMVDGAVDDTATASHRDGHRDRVAFWFPLFKQCSTLQVVHHQEVG